MKKFFISFLTMSVLFANTNVHNPSTTKNNLNLNYYKTINQKQIGIGTATAAVQYYFFSFVGKNKKIPFIAYKNFNNLFDTLVHYKPHQFKNDFTTDFLPATIFNDYLLYDDKGNFDKRKFFRLLQFQFIDTTIYLLQRKGIPTNITYTIQKKIGKTAVTITLNLQQILIRYANFLMYLKNLSNNDVKKFNDIFQKFAVFLFYNPDLTFYKPFQNILGTEITSALCLTDKMIEDPFSPLDFISMILGNYRGYDRTFLSKHKNIAKLVNYVLTGEYEKAAKMFLNDKKIALQRDFYLSTLAASAKIYRKNVVLPNNFSRIIYKKAIHILNKIPEKYKKTNIDHSAKYLETIIKIRKLAAEFTH